MRVTRNSAAQILGFALVAITAVRAHSWVDVLQVVGGGQAEKTGPSKGYIRNYQGHIDASSSYRIEDPSLGVPACAVFQSKFNDYNNQQYPQLVANPGAYIQGTYLENGHVSKKEVPESQTGKVYWYGSAQNNIQPTLAEVVKWTSNGKGGSGKGRLLAGPINFDDGVCVENNGTPTANQRMASGPGGPCKSTFKLPENLKPGSVYTVYWVWDFSLHFGPAKVGHTEWYTSCVDIKIGAGQANVSARNFVARSAKFRGRAGF